MDEKRMYCVSAPLERHFSLEILLGLLVRNNILQSCCKFLFLNQYFAAELYS